jgi:hypothetical protein
MLSVDMLHAIIHSVVMLSIVMLSVVASRMTNTLAYFNLLVKKCYNIGSRCRSKENYFNTHLALEIEKCLIEKKSFKTFFLIATIWRQCYKTFLPIIDLFQYKARVFVRLGWKSLPGTNTLAYYENY